MNVIRAGVNWGHVAVRAAIYGTISCTVGAVDPRHRPSIWAMRQWCRGATKGLRIRRKLVHGDRLDPRRQCVYVSNHLSLLDILVLGAYIPGDYRWLSKESIFRVPFLGWHMKLTGHIPVYRGDKRHLNRQMPALLHDAVRQGASLLFFPEGQRTRDGILGQFRLGAFFAAVDEGLPIVPIALRGTGELLKAGAMDLAIDHTRECSVTILEEISPLQPVDDSKQARRAAAIALCEAAQAAIAAELGQDAVRYDAEAEPSYMRSGDVSMTQMLH